MKIVLTMHEDGNLSDGPVMGIGKPYRYRVEGIPDERVYLNRADGCWTVMRIKNDRVTAWGSKYNSPTEALAQLQKEFD